MKKKHKLVILIPLFLISLIGELLLFNYMWNTERNAKLNIANALNLDVSTSSVEKAIYCRVINFRDCDELIYRVFFNNTEVFEAIIENKKITCIDLTEKKIATYPNCDYSNFYYSDRPVTEKDELIITMIEKINGGQCKIDALVLLVFLLGFDFFAFIVIPNIINAKTS